MIRGQHLRSFVGRGVIDDDAFHVGVGLVPDRIHGVGKETAVIEVHDDDADERELRSCLGVRQGRPPKIAGLQGKRSPPVLLLRMRPQRLIAALVFAHMDVTRKCAR